MVNHVRSLMTGGKHRIMNSRTTQKMDKPLTSHPNPFKRNAAPWIFFLLLSIKQRIGIPFAKAREITDDPINALNADEENKDNNDNAPQTLIDKNSAFFGMMDSSIELTSTQ